MILYTKENCSNCERIKAYIKKAGIEDIEIREMPEDIRQIMLEQGARTMPLLVESNILLSEGNTIIEYLIKRKIRF